MGAQSLGNIQLYLDLGDRELGKERMQGKMSEEVKKKVKDKYLIFQISLLVVLESKLESSPQYPLGIISQHPLKQSLNRQFQLSSCA